MVLSFTVTLQFEGLLGSTLSLCFNEFPIFCGILISLFPLVFLEYSDGSNWKCDIRCVGVTKAIDQAAEWSKV